MHPRQDILNWRDRFRTLEEDTTRSTDSSRLYWRLDDPFCQQLLTTGARQPIQSDEPQFVRAFFPFYRKASVLALPRNEEFLPQWLMLAFLAGQAYGERNPTEAEALFETDRSQSQAAWDLLAALRIQLNRSGVGRGRFTSALKHCCERHDRNSGQGATRQIITHSQNAIWAGLLAATGARNDILQMEFLENVRRAIRPSKLPLHFGAVINAARDAYGRPIFDLFLHPLLDVASEKYVPTPLEGRVILKFLNDELMRFGSKDEEGCPVSDRDLLTWVTNATVFAKELAHSDNDLLAKVFIETGQPQLRLVLKLLQRVSAGIKENSPARIANEVLRWHKDTFGWSKPKYYGEAVERIVDCVDMAIWLAWAPELGDFPDVSSKRGMTM
ncbi:MAG: hypothetical protein ACLQVY_20375 [Limisphaerales bacterium]